jgi:hypothetical protein
MSHSLLTTNIPFCSPYVGTSQERNTLFLNIYTDNLFTQDNPLLIVKLSQISFIPKWTARYEFMKNFIKKKRMIKKDFNYL